MTTVPNDTTQPLPTVSMTTVPNVTTQLYRQLLATTEILRIAVGLLLVAQKYVKHSSLLHTLRSCYPKKQTQNTLRQTKSFRETSCKKYILNKP